MVTIFIIIKKNLLGEGGRGGIQSPALCIFKDLCSIVIEEVGYAPSDYTCVKAFMFLPIAGAK